MDDSRALPHIVQRHAIPVEPVKGEELFRHVILDRVQRDDALSVQGADDVLIRQHEPSFVAFHIVKYRLCVLLCPQGFQIHQHDAGIDIEIILSHAEAQFVETV